MKKLVGLAFENIFFYWDFFSSAPWSLAGLSVKKKEMVGGLLDELGHLQLWWLDWRSSRPTPTNAWNFGYSPICLGWNPSFKFRAIASAWPDSKWCKAHRSWTLGWHTIITDGRSQPLEYIGRRLAKDLCHAADGLATVTKYSNGSGDEKNFLLRFMGLICPWMMLAIQKSSPFKNIFIQKISLQQGPKMYHISSRLKKQSVCLSKLFWNINCNFYRNQVLVKLFIIQNMSNNKYLDILKSTIF